MTGKRNVKVVVDFYEKALRKKAESGSVQVPVTNGAIRVKLCAIDPTLIGISDQQINQGYRLRFVELAEEFRRAGITVTELRLGGSNSRMLSQEEQDTLMAAAMNVA